MHFILSKEQILPLYSTEGNAGCIASNRITIDGMSVGYMYREEASINFPDSGWRFFAGDENAEYADDPSNFNIFDLNTICNYDKNIIPFLSAPSGTAYIKQNDGFILDT